MAKKIAISKDVTLSSNLAWLLNPVIWYEGFAANEQLEASSHSSNFFYDSYVTGIVNNDDWTGVFATNLFSNGSGLDSSFPLSDDVMGECY